jgi:2-(1,2-epoxy-1,2-dihydrophenyl)acetyl-CoA isomerase
MVKTEMFEEVAVLTLQRPQALNALDPALLGALLLAIEDAVNSRSAQAIVLTGAGRAFSAGGDVRWFDAQAVEGPDRLAQAIPALMEDAGNPVVQALAELPVPVISAVNGPCVGGAVGIALIADVVVAARSAYFLLPQVSTLGVVPDFGATWAAGRLLGRARALGWSLLGDRISAEKAEQWGLIWSCVDDSQLLSAALKTARQLANVPARAVVGTRKLLDDAIHDPLDRQMMGERLWQRELVRAPFFRQACAQFSSPRIAPEAKDSL